MVGPADSCLVRVTEVAADGGGGGGLVTIACLYLALTRARTCRCVCIAHLIFTITRCAKKRFVETLLQLVVFRMKEQAVRCEEPDSKEMT